VFEFFFVVLIIIMLLFCEGFSTCNHSTLKVVLLTYFIRWFYKCIIVSFYAMKVNQLAIFNSLLQLEKNMFLHHNQFHDFASILTLLSLQTIVQQKP
jgi:hypothetical protein